MTDQNNHANNEFSFLYYYSQEGAKIKQPNFGDIGFDITTPKDVFIPAFNSDNSHIVRIPTGIHIALPFGYWCELRERSSVAGGNPNKGIVGGLILLGGIIDSSYRGEIIVAMANISGTRQSFSAGDKIAQLIIRKDETYGNVLVMQKVDSLEGLGATNRGAGGFGSTGKS